MKARRHGGLDRNDNKVTKDADPMKEGLFRQCMKEIDDYLRETKGCHEMHSIDSKRTSITYSGGSVIGGSSGGGRQDGGRDGLGGPESAGLRLRHVKQGRSAMGARMEREGG